MSAAVYISTRSPSSANRVAVNGKYFVLHIDNISAIGEEHGLKRIDDYVSQSLEDTLEFIDQSIISKEQIEQNYKEQWYDPKEGLNLVEKYIDIVTNCQSLSDSTKKQCLEDLESYKLVLEILVKENIEWHFSYDI